MISNFKDMLTLAGFEDICIRDLYGYDEDLDDYIVTGFSLAYTRDNKIGLECFEETEDREYPFGARESIILNWIAENFDTRDLHIDNKDDTYSDMLHTDFAECYGKFYLDNLHYTNIPHETISTRIYNLLDDALRDKLTDDEWGILMEDGCAIAWEMLCRDIPYFEEKYNVKIVNYKGKVLGVIPQPLYEANWNKDFAGIYATAYNAGLAECAKELKQLCEDYINAEAESIILNRDEEIA